MFKGHQIRPIKANARLLLSLCIGSGLSVHIKPLIHVSLFFNLDLYIKRTKLQKDFFKNGNKSPKEDKNSFNSANLMSFWHFLLGCHFTRYLEENVFSNHKINLAGRKKGNCYILLKCKMQYLR